MLEKDQVNLWAMISIQFDAFDFIIVEISEYIYLYRMSLKNEYFADISLTPLSFFLNTPF